MDRVDEFVDGEYIRVRKCITVNEAMFQGHFPGDPVFPGVLLIEAMAQACGLYVGLSGGVRGKFYLSGIEKARFKKPVRPGDVVIIEARLKRERMGIFFFSVKTMVDGEIVASCELSAARVS